MPFKNDVFLFLISLLGVLYEMIYNGKQTKRLEFEGQMFCYDPFNLLLKVREKFWKVMEKSRDLGLIFLWQPCFTLVILSATLLPIKSKQLVLMLFFEFWRIFSRSIGLYLTLKLLFIFLPIFLLMFLAKDKNPWPFTNISSPGWVSHHFLYFIRY